MRPTEQELPPAACNGLGYTYVLAFSEGTVKVGNTTDPMTRMRSHVSNAAAFGIEPMQVWISTPHAGYLESEQRLIDAAAQVAVGRRRREYFTGISFDQVRDLADSIARQSVQQVMTEVWALADAGDRLGAIRAMRKVTPEIGAAVLAVDGYLAALRNERAVAA